MKRRSSLLFFFAIFSFFIEGKEFIFDIEWTPQLKELTPPEVEILFSLWREGRTKSSDKRKIFFYFLSQKMFQTARDFYEEEKLESHDLDVRFNYATLLALMGNYNESLEAYLDISSLLEKFPDQREIYKRPLQKNLSLLLWQLQQQEENSFLAGKEREEGEETGESSLNDFSYLEDTKSVTNLNGKSLKRYFDEKRKKGKQTRELYQW